MHVFMREKTGTLVRLTTHLDHWWVIRRDLYQESGDPTICDWEWVLEEKVSDAEIREFADWMQSEPYTASAM